MDKFAIVREHEATPNGSVNMRDIGGGDSLPFEASLALGLEMEKEAERPQSSSNSSSSKKICSVRNPAGGTIHFAWQPSSASFLAAAIEGTHYVFIRSRTGATLHKIPLKGNCTGMAWDADGDFLAIMTESSSLVVLWDSHTQKVTAIDSHIKDPGTCLAWSKVGKILAYATSKGNLLIYNQQSLRRIPVIGKNTKRIVAAAWSNDNMLALATVDNVLTINTMDGDEIKMISLRAKVSDLKFGHIKEDYVNSALDNTVSLIVGDKTLYLHKIEDGPTGPLELGFQPRYGNIVAHHWHGDGYILCAFSGGFIVMISSHHTEIGSELILTELKGEPLRSAALSERYGQYAVAYGDNLVEIRQASDPNKLITTVNIFEAEQRIRPPLKCSWSHDGQLLGVVATGGDLHVFLTSVPLLGSSYGPYILQRSSLHEITLHQYDGQRLTSERSIRLEVEPTILAIGPNHLAAVLNNRVYFYTIDDVMSNHREPSFIREYNANVIGICMNMELVSVRAGEKIYLQPLDENSLREPLVFPDTLAKQSNKIITHCMTSEFLVYALDNRMFKSFSLAKSREANSIQMGMSSSIKSMYPDNDGNYVVCIDHNGMSVCYDIAFGVPCRIKPFPAKHDGLLWDVHKGVTHLFVVFAMDFLLVSLYIVKKQITTGTNIAVAFLGNVEIFPFIGCLPLQLRNGKVYYQTTVGAIESTGYMYTYDKDFWDMKRSRKMKLGSHAYDPNASKYPPALLKLDELLQFGRWKDGFKYCKDENKHILWEKLGEEALTAMKIDYAIKAYSKICNFGMVEALRNVSLIRDDHKSACGQVALLLRNYQQAEELLLNSSDPYSALRMRMLMNHWEEAEGLASQFADEYVCEVTAKYGLQEEHLGNNMHAMELYERALEHAQMYGDEFLEGLDYCEAGLARTSIKFGTPQKGIDIALSLRDPKLLKECAQLLEKKKLYAESAVLYEECSIWNKAGLLYIRCKNWAKVESIIPNCTSQQVFNEYGEAKELEEKYSEAAEYFEKGGNIEAACKNYTLLNRPDDAIRLVKEFKSVSGALVTARYFEDRQDFDTAIRFLILSNCHDEALQMAFRYGKSELYVAIIQDIITNKEYGDGDGYLLPEYREGIKRVGQHFEEQKDNIKAGKYYHLAGQYRKAFIILMKSASSGVAYDEENLLNLLTEATAACKDEHFEKQYVEFCLGEKDGIPKDPTHLLAYYLKVRKFSEATRTALIMSSDYLQSGNLKGAHKALVDTVKEIRKRRSHVQKDLMDELIIVHFFRLSAKQASIGNHAIAGRLSARVLDNVSKLPKHSGQVMSQAVIFCQKAGLHSTSMKACFELMKPENRHLIPVPYKTKFETMVRKTGKTPLVDAPDEQSLCPYCTNNTANYNLVCGHCTADIPFCCASGRHIIASDLTACPRCNFPAIRQEIVSLLSKEPICPICEEDVPLSEWPTLDFNQYIRSESPMR